MQNDEVVLSWSTHRLRQAPGGLAVVLPCLALAGFSGASVFHSALYGILVALALALAIGDYLLPVRYTITKTYAESACGLSKSRIGLADVRKILVSGNEVRLSPLAKRSRLDAFRGVRLICSGNQELVLAALADLGKLEASRRGRGRKT